MNRVPRVVVDAGSYSLSEASIAGAGVRLAEISQVLSHRYRVEVIARAATDLFDLGLAKQVEPGTEAIDAINSADAVLFFDSPNRERIEYAAAQRKLIVSECRAPIEQMSYPSVIGRRDASEEHQKFLGPYGRLLQVSHHFICRSQAEKSILTATLCTVGRITPADIAESSTLEHLITTIPVGFSKTCYDYAKKSQPIHLADFLWTGGIWDFFDPIMFVDAIKLLRDRQIEATASFLHANPTDDTAQIISRLHRRIDELQIRDLVSLNSETLAFSARNQYLKGAKAYVCIAKPGVENQTATRLRLRDTFLHGVPTVIDHYGISGDLVEGEHLGIALKCPTAETLADALEEIIRAPHDVPGKRMDRMYEQSMVGFITHLDKMLLSR